VASGDYGYMKIGMTLLEGTVLGPCGAHQVGHRPPVTLGQRPRCNAGRCVVESSEIQAPFKLKRNFSQEFSSAYRVHPWKHSIANRVLYKIDIEKDS
jgi:hypothetical protein